MRPRRQLPSFKRMAVEWLAMILVYLAVFLVASRFIFSKGSQYPLVLALVAMLATTFAARWTRPRGALPPSDGDPPTK